MKPYIQTELQTIEIETKAKLGSGIIAKGTMTESGLFLATKSEEKLDDKYKTTAEGVVFGIGPEVEGLEVGWRVIFNRHAARPFLLEDEEYLTINSNEIFAVVTQAQ